jgi:hypothetical protein
MQVRSASVHAGRRSLRRRRGFVVVVFAMMVAVAVILALSSARARDHTAKPRRPASGASSVGGPRVQPSPNRSSGGGGTSSQGAVTARVAHQDLVAALAPVLESRTGNLAVGVVDLTTGAGAVYDGTHRFHTASIVKVDILATLLLQHQLAGTQLSGVDEELAARMIENSDDDAATDLWNDVGGADGIADANVHLGLSHTTPGQGGYWGLTSTTVPDQLTLLSDLVSAHSALTAASRSYELSLMREVEPDQAWGVTRAATPGTRSAVKNGWLPDPQLWVINSVGVIRHDGQVLLVAVLSDDQPTEAGGIDQDEAAAVAAVDAITAARS